MAYSELIKSFDRIRDYMRQFYIYGFKSRTEYDKRALEAMITSVAVLKAGLETLCVSGRRRMEKTYSSP